MPEQASPEEAGVEGCGPGAETVNFTWPGLQMCSESAPSAETKAGCLRAQNLTCSLKEISSAQCSEEQFRWRAQTLGTVSKSSASETLACEGTVTLGSQQ